MGLFGKKKSSGGLGLIGVDIGAGGIKAVELTPEKGRLRLGTYGYSEFKSPGERKTALIDDPKTAARILTQIHKESGMKADRANASLPSQAVFHAIITIPQPKSHKEDIKPYIEAQVSKLLPRPIDEMIIDSTVIDKHLLPKPPAAAKKEKGKNKASEKELAGQVGSHEERLPDKKHIRVLVSGAPKELVAKYVEAFKLSKLDLVALETEAFALVRSLVGKDKARIMIVDIGYSRTNITVVHEGIPFLHRSIKAGGAIVTDMIAKQTGVSVAEAEQTKLDLAISGGEGEIPPVLKEAMMPIVHEVRYSLDLYGQQEFHEHQTVEKIIVTGGSAHLPHIDPLLTQELDASVYIGDPWARIAAPDGMQPMLVENGPRFSVAIGLAMKK